MWFFRHQLAGIAEIKSTFQRFEEEINDMIKGVLLDLSGTVHIGPNLIPGSAQAVARLREAGIPLRFVTNTSRMSRRMLMETLGRMGLEVTSDDLLTAPAAAAFLRRRIIRDTSEWR
jgi:ribonucleotide monophosphatase NagD (HAD superfamily)